MDKNLKDIIADNCKAENNYINFPFISNIPIINIDGVSIGLELLHNDNPNIKGLCNIFVVKENRIIKYNNVFLDLEYSLLYPNSENMEYSNIYRESVGLILTDLERNKRMMETRDGHFGILRFDKKKGAKKFYNPEYISLMSSYKEKGFIPDKHQEEENIIK